MLKCLSRYCYLQTRKLSGANQLTQIGFLLDGDRTSGYTCGQLFIHKLFGYRGIIVKGFSGNLYCKGSNNIVDASKYYLALVDSTDFKKIKNHTAKISAIIDDSNICGIRNMDYVTQNDVLPYITTDDLPLSNDMFDRFFISNKIEQGNYFTPTELLNNLLESVKQSLEVTDVYEDITNDFKVTIMPFYLGCIYENNSPDPIRCWRYMIRLEYLGKSSMVMRRKDFRLLNAHGRHESLDSKGIQPILNQDQPVYQHHSLVQMKCSYTHLTGQYTFESETGQVITVKVPSIRLTHNLNVTNKMNV